MSTDAQFVVVVVTTLFLYVVAPALLLLKRWPLRAGLAMLVVAFLPLVWQFSYTDSDAPGLIFLFIPMLPIPIVLISAGIVLGCYRGIRRCWRIVHHAPHRGAC